MVNDDIVANDNWEFVHKKTKAKNKQNVNHTIKCTTNKINQYPTDNRGASSGQRINNAQSSGSIQNYNHDVSKLIDITILKLNELMNIFKTHHLNEVLKCRVHQQDKYISSIVGLGIGSFSTSHLALIQLAIMLSLSSFNVTTTTSLSNNNTINNNENIFSAEAPLQVDNEFTEEHSILIYAYDPVFTAVEIEICRRLNIRLLNNCQGKYSAIDINQHCNMHHDNDTNNNNNSNSHQNYTSPDAIANIGSCSAMNLNSKDDATVDSTTANRKAVTLFYMPHCPYRLYCNLLWRNWFHLGRLIILGNSFSSYGIRRMHMLNPTGGTKKKNRHSTTHKSDNGRNNDGSVAVMHVTDSTDLISRVTSFNPKSIHVLPDNSAAQSISNSNNSDHCNDNDNKSNLYVNKQPSYQISSCRCLVYDYSLFEDNRVWPSQLLKTIANTSFHKSNIMIQKKNNINNDSNMDIGNDNIMKGNTKHSFISSTPHHQQSLPLYDSKEIVESVTVALANLENACTDISFHSFHLATETNHRSPSLASAAVCSQCPNNNNNHDKRDNDSHQTDSLDRTRYCCNLPTEEEMDIASLADCEVW